MNRTPEHLAAADRRFQQQAALSLGLRWLQYAAALVVFLFALDVALQLGAGWRLALGLALVAACLFLVGRLLYLAQFRRSRPERIARVLESRDPSLGSKLINELQLRAQLAAAEPAPETRALAERALHDYSSVLRDRDFSPLTKSPTLRRDFQFAALALGGAALLLGAVYPVSGPEWLRFLDPFGDHPPYSFTQVRIVEPAETAHIDYNGSVTIKAETSGHHPKDLYLTYEDPVHPGERRMEPMFNKGEAGFLQVIQNIKSDLTVIASTKNGRSVSKRCRIVVGLVPKIEEARIEITAPAYTGLKPHETKFDFKNVTALSGSKIKLSLRSNRPLSGGTILIGNGPGVELAATGENEVSGVMIATESARLQFSVVDQVGRVSADRPSASLTVTQDLPPSISIDAPAQDGFVCEDFVVEARISAADDYGLKTIRIQRALNDVFSTPKTTTFTEIVRSADQKLTFDLKSLGVQPGDAISFFAEAIDTCPEPHLVRTDLRRLMVITSEEYNDFLRERSDISDIQGKYAALENEFQGRIDEQKALAEKSRAAREAAAKESDPKQSAAQLNKLAAEQAEINKRLEMLAEKMDHFVRKQPLYDLESDLQKSLSSKAEKIRQSVAANREALKDSPSEASSPSPAAPSPDEKEALAKLESEARNQAERLQPEQQSGSDEILPTLKDAALMNKLVNDFNAVKFLAETQATLSAQARPFKDRTAASEEDRLSLRQLAGTEKAVEWALGRVVQNLRDHADEAQAKFPKASAGARDLAKDIEDRRLKPLAGRAADAMAQGDGPQSFALAEGLREQLEQLFQETKPSGGKMRKELDEYLKLKRNANGGNTFSQMSKSRKFGFGHGKEKGQAAAGRGGAGDSSDDPGGALDGYDSAMAGNFDVMGNESFGGDPQSSSAGNGMNGLPPAAGSAEKSVVAVSPSPDEVEVNRQSGSTKTESGLNEYRGIIDAYFDAITK